MSPHPGRPPFTHNMPHSPLFPAVKNELLSFAPLNPPDPIFNLNTQFKTDSFADKVNVGVGAYRTDEGKPWVLPVVKRAEKQIVADSTLDHEYLPIDGLAEFTEASARLVLGKDSPAIKENRYCAVQGISGTGSLRIGGAFIARFAPSSIVYISNPTWGPHRTIFGDCGLQVREYPYYKKETNGIDFENWLKTINEAPSQSVFVLHACAHNPTGIDPTPEEWIKVARAIQERGHFAFFDCAYQGFASGDVDKDAYAVRKFVEMGMDVFVAQSYSKNFGLYNERTGTLTVVSQSTDIAKNVRSQLAKLIRSMISNPPAFGARIVSRILNDEQLYQEWRVDLKVMVDRIHSMRKQLYDLLCSLGTPGDWKHVVTQIGMFSYTGMSAKQSLLMREKFHIYMTNNGRISIAGLNNRNVKYFAESMDWVVRNCQE